MTGEKTLGARENLEIKDAWRQINARGCPGTLASNDQDW